MNVTGVTFGGNEQNSAAIGGVAPSGESKAGSKPNALSDEERQQVDKLKKRDTEVKSHEAAHVAAGGAYVRGGASYEYQTGPDGKKYAIGGEVSIDTSPISGNPQATISKMETVKRAALAPAQPSGQDMAVAAAAASAEVKAQQELVTKNSAAPASGASAGAKGAPVATKNQEKPLPLFPKSSESAYIKHSAISNKSPASAVQSLLDLMA
jgi:hypothetical protein